MAHNDGRPFTTTDRDNDGWLGFNCAEEYGRAGWWYGHCSLSNLNGVYHSPRTTYRAGIFWWYLQYHEYDSLKATTIMIQT